MTKPVPPVSDTPAQRRAGRRTTDPHVVAAEAEAAASAGTNLPVVAGPLLKHDEQPAGAVEAQLIGQSGQKRGLKGGQPVLDQARHAYLGAEYSGRADRRPLPGRITKSEI